MRVIQLTSPVTFPAPPALSWWRPVGFAMLIHPSPIVTIHVLASNGTLREERIVGEEADAVIGFINTADMSQQDLLSRIMQWLIDVKGYAGTITEV